MSLHETLKEYSKSEMYSFHMPGHKRMLDGCYKIDMTEVEGVDDLHDPDGVIADEQNRLAKLYKVNKAFMLVGGSTVGNLSAIYGTLNENDLILIGRNSHKSVYNGATLRHLRVGYIYSKVDENGIYEASSLKDIKDAVEREGEMPKAVLITSPTYEGYFCEIEKISEYCHKNKIILIVDEAHGAHLGFNQWFPNQTSRYADITITSLHKTLPCLTQTAAMLVSSDKVNITRIREALDIFETSSPSYVLMNSISECLDILENSEDLFRKYVDNLKKFYSFSGQLRNLRVLNESYQKKDMGKLVISTKHTSITGIELARILREKYKIETELSSFSYVLAMTSIMDTKEGFNRLKIALEEIDKSLQKGEIKVPVAKTINPSKKMELWQAKTEPFKEIDLSEAEGKISTTMICLYPPGAPIVVPGEEVTNQAIDVINDALEKGIHVTGLNNGRICVVN
ncbi:aminotransferase class I/II-fold pyridoxal phosphate-dependent enzyme [Pseudobutyrivibrio sp. MD2005]|uniref:aminotransferase class I/II-fold pyridoxal phosphate-dependent enzyme n=1 Tax=Pseudobutyrivibrio sp. MD2005 TaxID=1410616 RepID=UPI00055E4F3F|nr:aminotransferase class I/II-fold pyridoxal phosphate-dependent enzyme [Pseudobutyrivibrio sp. MD2005]